MALILFWIPVAAPKGGRLHIRIGWAYVICMSAVVLTAFSMSGLAFADPLGVRRFAQPLSQSETVEFIHKTRLFSAFLAYLAGVTLASGWQGIGALLTRRDPKLLRTPFTFALNGLVLISALAILLLGLRERSAVLLGLSPVGIFLGGGNLSYLLRGPRSRMHWWYEHLGSMLGTGIAGYTAFLVFGGSRLFPSLARTQFYAVFWVLPAAIGTPAIFLTVAYYRRKFHEDGRSQKLGGSQVNAAI